MSEPDREPPGPPPSGSDLTPTAQVVDFPCANCGARTTWDPDADALACDHCGSVTAVPRAEDRIVERALEDAGQAARGLGLETRVLRCGECGAQVTLEGAATASQCVFCGSSSVLAQAANRNVIRPESLVPIDVGRATVEAGFKRWLEGLWFRPSALKQLRSFEAVGIYVPYWTFDAQAHSSWSADAGYYYYETQVVPTYVNGKLRMRTRQVRRVRWVPAWGERDDVYDDLHVHASKGLLEELALELGEFDTSRLVPYRPEYLAGWRAEEYQVDLEQAWLRARERMVELQRRRCSGDVPGDTQRGLRVENRIEDARWKHVLLPIWSLTYEHGGESYAVLVHGQTGKVCGRAPLSWAKILGLVFGVLGLGALVLLIAFVAGG